MPYDAGADFTVEILGTGLLLEHRPNRLHLDAFAHEQPMQVRDVPTEEPLNDAPQLLGGDLLERVRGDGRPVLRLVRVPRDQRSARCVEDEFIIGEVELDRALAAERPDVLDQERLSLGEGEVGQTDGFDAPLKGSAQNRKTLGDGELNKAEVEVRRVTVVLVEATT